MTCSHRLPAIALLLATAAWAAAPRTAPLYLDFHDATEARANVETLRPANTFTPEHGLGWTTPPASSFALPTSWTGVRPAALLDGVSGRDFTLRIDLAAGRWTALVFLDDGHRDAHRVRLQVNGRDFPHNPREFGLEEEPGPPPINRYRVAQIAFAAQGATDVRFTLDAAHGARVLALHLLPDPTVESERADWFLRRLADVGAHPSQMPLDALRFELAQHERDSTLGAFATYWNAQLALLAEAEKWFKAGGWDWFSAQTRSSMFVRYKIALSLLDPLVEHPDGARFPLRDRAQWLRARLLHWIWLEQHLEPDGAAAKRDLAELRQRFPDDPLIAMYSGQPVDLPDPFDHYVAPAGAPAWSTAQFETLQRLRQVAHYWIDERQISNGELGGKPDDDVELLRWWPVLMFTGDRKAVAGYRRLAEGVWFSRNIDKGYSRESRDVEHSAEFIADTIPFLAFMLREDRWTDRLRWSYQHFRDLWTGRNLHGDLQFKSAWIGANDIQLDPPKNRDLAMNARATKAVRYYAWLKPDADADRLLHDWSLTWAKAAGSTAKGKPPGLFPASLRWPDAVFNGDEPTWHHANMFWRYFDWRGDGQLYDQLLYSWLRTGDNRLLEPLHATLALLKEWADPARRTNASTGSAAWAADRLFSRGDFWGVVAQWRFESGDARHDAFLRQHGPPYLKFRLDGDAAPLAEGLQRSLLDVLRFNTPMRTSEVLFTDRVHVSRDVAHWDGIDLLAAMLTGNHVSSSMSPYYHVAWEDAPPTLTALVTDTGSTSLAAEIFLHQAEPARVTARLFRLPPGRYRATITTADGRPLSDSPFDLQHPDHRLPLDLPGATLLYLRIQP